MGSIVSEIIGYMTDGIVGIGEAIGGGLSSIAQSVFLTGEAGAETLSTFGALIVIFAGISLALNLTRLLINWLTGLGGGGM